MIKYLILFIFLFVISTSVKGQELRIEGRVLDALTKIPVPNAQIKFNQKLFISDNTGYFSGSHVAGSFTVTIRQGNFNEMSIRVNITSDTTLVLYYEKIVSIDEVTVLGSRISGLKKEENLEITKITPSEISFLPGLGSNDDLLKEIQLMPGIQSGNEGSSGLIVRGGQFCPESQMGGQYYNCNRQLLRSGVPYSGSS